MSSHQSDVDVIVAGGGLAGLSAAAAFGKLGFSVVCVDPAPPVTDRYAAGADLRSTALLQPSQRFLDDLGLWAGLAEQAMPLQVMRIVDAGGPAPEARTTRDFDAADLGDLPFGWNLPNWFLRGAFERAVAAMGRVDLRYGRSVRHVMTRTAEARVTLDDGSHLRCRLLIGADGRNSQVREAAGIGVRTTRYGQRALAFAVTHPIPHQNISTEIHRSGGPFTLVPLPDLDGRPSSAVVWMERAAEAQRLAALPSEQFDAEATERSCHVLGPLKMVGGRAVWPIISQIADRLTAERTALVAEAAHVMPPIGAQGLNTSLADIRALRDLAAASPADLGNPEMLARYQRARWPGIAARVAGVDALNRTSMIDIQAIKDARMKGLNLLHDVAPVRRALMKTGLGAVL